MRGSRSTLSVRCHALALSGFGLLGGCAVSTVESREHIAEAASELDEVISPRLAGSYGTERLDGDCEGDIKGSPCDSGESASAVTDLHEPEPNPWRDPADMLTPNEGDADRGDGDEQAAEPLPWRPKAGVPDRDGSTEQSATDAQ